MEGLKDVTFALAPLTGEEADYLLESTWAGRRLGGYRNLPPADRAAVKHALICLGHLVTDYPQIAEIEINPMRVFANGRGAMAVDARIRIS